MSSVNEELRKVTTRPPPVYREQFPLLAFGAVLLVLLTSAETIVGALANQSDAILRLYWTVFAWSAVQMLSCLIITCVIVTTDHGFLKALRGTKTLSSVRASSLKTLVVSLSLMATALPLIVGAIFPAEPLGFWYVFAAVWISLFVGCALAFGRLICIFIRLAVVDPNKNGA